MRYFRKHLRGRGEAFQDPWNDRFTSISTASSVASNLDDFVDLLVLFSSTTASGTGHCEDKGVMLVFSIQ
jgi:hypothetical protein